MFYDGHCPLCIKEISYLNKHDSQRNLKLVDIQSDQFSDSYPNLDKNTLDARLHGLTQDGRIITGLDVTYLAFKYIGKGWIYAPLRWPIIRIAADYGYNIFAKHRHTLAYWLTGKKSACPSKNRINNE